MKIKMLSMVVLGLGSLSIAATSMADSPCGSELKCANNVCTMVDGDINYFPERSNRNAQGVYVLSDDRNPAHNKMPILISGNFGECFYFNTSTHELLKIGGNGLAPQLNGRNSWRRIEGTRYECTRGNRSVCLFKKV